MIFFLNERGGKKEPSNQIALEWHKRPNRSSKRSKAQRRRAERSLPPSLRLPTSFSSSSRTKTCQKRRRIFYPSAYINWRWLSCCWSYEIERKIHSPPPTFGKDRPRESERLGSRALRGGGGERQEVLYSSTALLFKRNKKQLKCFKLLFCRELLPDSNGETLVEVAVVSAMFPCFLKYVLEFQRWILIRESLFVIVYIFWIFFLAYVCFYIQKSVPPVSCSALGPAASSLFNQDFRTPLRECWGRPQSAVHMRGRGKESQASVTGLGEGVS